MVPCQGPRDAVVLEVFFGEGEKAVSIGERQADIQILRSDRFGNSNSTRSLVRSVQLASSLLRIVVISAGQKKLCGTLLASTAGLCFGSVVANMRGGAEMPCAMYVVRQSIVFAVACVNTAVVGFC